MIDEIRTTADEMNTCARWIGENLAETSKPPFSFFYGGDAFPDMRGTWKTVKQTTDAGNKRKRHTLTYSDTKTGLAVRCAAVEYGDFPAVEWSVSFKNAGSSDTPVLEEVLGLDLRLRRREIPRSTVARQVGGEFALHHFKGDYNAPEGYEPQRLTLQPRSSYRFAPAGGRGTNQSWPYFNLEMDDGGLIVAVGWPGQWSADFKRDADRDLNIHAGQERTRFILRPGEEVRTPLIVLFFWQGGDWIRSQNLWRRWMVAHNLPRPSGKLPSPMLQANSSIQFNEMIDADEENQKLFVDRYQEKGVDLDYWWMDAGWYKCAGSWRNTGTWEVDTRRFPNGLRAVSDHARASGTGTIVWFEPERVTPGSWLFDQHPEWLLGPVESGGENRLLNLGNTEALGWLIGRIDTLITEQGIDLYRQDFNFNPLDYWRANDSEDRLGITENLYVSGYLAFWDELRRRHPDLLIDSCASGGRRNDLETLRRAVPLHPTDYNYSDLPVKQAFHHVLNLWIPYYGAAVRPIERVDTYGFRSAMCLSTGLRFDARRDDLDYQLLCSLIRQFREVAPHFYGDFYPLLPYSRDEREWIAWQFDRPDLGEGSVIAFRRRESPYESACFTLHGLDKDADYTLTSLDSGEAAETSGRDLADSGFSVALAEKPSSGCWVYRTGRPAT